MHDLIAILIVYQHNIKLLHWTCVGKEFDATHKYLDDFSSQLNEYIDEIAEIMVSKGMILPTLMEAVKILENHDETEHLIISGDDVHTCEDCHQAVTRMFTVLYDAYKKAHFSMGDNGVEYESDIVSVLDDHMKWIRKEIFYKMKLRMM